MPAPQFRNIRAPVSAVIVTELKHGAVKKMSLKYVEENLNLRSKRQVRSY
jgi:hypothetical protein